MMEDPTQRVTDREREEVGDRKQEDDYSDTGTIENNLTPPEIWKNKVELPSQPATI